jgi:hypothetical protein
MAVFWVVAPCSLVEDNQCFRGACCFIIRVVMMEAANTSETSVNFYQATRRNIPEESHFHVSPLPNWPYSYLSFTFNVPSWLY